MTHCNKNNNNHNNNTAAASVNISNINNVRIAIVGCVHGALDYLYSVLISQSIDLLLCTGDFQALVSVEDYPCISIPNKYKQLGDFYNYYSGNKVAPILTIYIGGNHENSKLHNHTYHG
jgi:lariat debranching enzyme